MRQRRKDRDAVSYISRFANHDDRLFTATKTSRRKAVRPPINASMDPMNRLPITPLISKPKKCPAKAIAISRHTNNAAMMSSVMPR
jgi:hypothetical protein